MITDARYEPPVDKRHSRLSANEVTMLEYSGKGKGRPSSEYVSGDDDNDSRGSPWTIEAVDGELNDDEVCNLRMYLPFPLIDT